MLVVSMKGKMMGMRGRSSSADKKKRITLQARAKPMEREKDNRSGGEERDTARKYGCASDNGKMRVLRTFVGGRAKASALLEGV